MHEYSPREPRVITGPPCAKCNMETLVIRIQPDRPGIEHRTFQCAGCDDVITLIAEDR